ncbi:MAG: HEAT repeat domain-containing protein, partial [Gemmataceae bacterium]|nr:HEAT repeat domain-containing protein [Gemmataceae bacterium]MDW8267050.1 HEAT repeat domain-containing protein [Gemmataceae bacterium]
MTASVWIAVIGGGLWSVTADPPASQPTWRDDLASSQPARQLVGLRHLADQRGALEPPIARLMELLRSDSEEVRLRSALVLGSLGRSAVAALTAALADPNEGVRGYAAWALGLSGNEAEAAVPALARLARDPQATVRRLAVESLGRIAAQPEVAVPVLAEALGDPSAEVRDAAVWALV